MDEDDSTHNSHQPGLGISELELLRSMFDQAPMFIGITEGSNHRIKYVNAAFRKLLGNRRLPTGTPASKVLPDIKGDDEDEVKSTLERLDHIYATGDPLIVNEFKTLLDRKGNGTLEKGHFNFIYQPLKNKQGEVHGLFLAGYEVSDHVEARQEKVHSKKRLQLALEGAQLGFWETELGSGFSNFMSQQAKKHFGFSTSDGPLGEDQIMEAIHPEDRSYVTNEFNKAVESAQMYEAQFRVIWPDESVHWLTGRGQCLYDEEGQPYRLIGVTIDVTKHKQAEQKLEEAVRLRDEFLAVASHELQTPVTSMKIQAELFERQLRNNGNEAHVRQAGKLNSQIDQLSGLTGKLLDVTRMQQQGLALERTSFSLEELIEETVAMLSPISHHTIEVQGEVKENIYADESRIGQVLTNLLENAIKYSREADRIVVRYKMEKNKVVVSVIDFGIGIAIEEREKIFDRFFKGGGESKRTYPGFGIGLYISAQIIRRHGGVIRAEGNNGQGSVFTFTLPQEKS